MTAGNATGWLSWFRFFVFLFYISYYKNMITHLQETWKIQNKVTWGLCDLMDCSTPGFHVHHHLWELTQTHVHWVNDAIQPSHPLSSPSLPTFSLSQHQGLFQWVNSSHHLAKYWSFSFNISPSNEYSGLIPIRKDWLDLFDLQVTLKSLLQHCSSKASILQHSPFFIVQLSHPYMTTGKNHSFD